jgi:hypothetical protein
MSDQKNWDAALIKTWRLAGCIGDVYALFKAISGKRTDECDPPLKRMPPSNIPWKVGVRVFVANHLSKISNRLWDQPPEKDILLLRKLETSAYDTEVERLHRDSELEAQRKMVKQNRERQSLITTNISNRNQATDWNVVKSSARTGRTR